MANVGMFAVAALVVMATLKVQGAAEIDPDYECRRNGQFAHPDCWKWYNCGEGTAYVMECPEPLLYDPEFVWCDYPNNVTCGDRNPRPSTTHFEKTLAAALTEDLIDPDYECRRNGQFMHPDCWKWYNCGGGIAYVMECQDPLLYDPEFVWCDYPYNVTCGDRNPRPLTMN